MHRLLRLSTLFCCLLFSALFAWAQPEYNMTDNFVDGCTGILYDSGGPDANYGDGENFTLFICEADVACIRMTIDELNLGFFDSLIFYDGMGTDNPVIEVFHTVSTTNEEYISTSGDCLTVQFISNAAGNQAGWRAEWECFADECPSEPLPPSSPQDCINAIPICQNIYSEENAYLGQGFIEGEISTALSCLGGCAGGSNAECNDVWYTFTVQESGNLGFEITPNVLFEDYDWAVFNLTDAECSQIAVDGSLIVSCNYSGSGGVTGPTGATSETSVGGAGVNQNALIPVLAGETYVINVSQFSSTPNGYTIDFGLSTAVIFDDVSPVFTELETPACGAGNLNISFSENILCSSVDAGDFVLTGPGGPYDISIATEICVDPDSYERDHSLQVDPPLTIGGDYELALVDTVLDICGNVGVFPASFAFSIPVIPFEGTVEDVELCEGSDAPPVITVDGPGTYNFYGSGGVNPDNLLFTGQTFDYSGVVVPGQPYTFFITQVEDGCESEPVEVTVSILLVDNAAFGLVASACKYEGEPNPEAQIAPDTDPGEFSIDGDGVINASSGEIDLEQTPAGTYTVTYTTNGSCPASSSEEITVTAADISSFELPAAVCSNGSANPIPQLDDGAASGSFSISGGGVADVATGEIDLEQTPAGTYTLTYTTTGECPTSSEQSIAVYSLPNIDIILPEEPCLNDGTDAFSVQIIVSGGEGGPYMLNVGGGADMEVENGMPVSLELSGTGEEYAVSVVEPAIGCEVGDSFVSPVCPTCQPYAGEMPSEGQVLCAGETASATAEGFLLDEGAVLAYVLHTSADETLGDVLAYNASGEFAFADAPGAEYYATYYVSAVTGFDADGDGLPNYPDECTAVAAGTPVVFFRPVEFIINEHCDWLVGDFTVTVAVRGGAPEYDPTLQYGVSGDYAGDLYFGENFSVIFPEDGTNIYSFTATDPSGCPGISFTSEEFICIKTPIELLRFAGKVEKEGNLLYWTTATETENDLFTLERSLNGTDFSAIAQIDGAGTSLSEIDYEYMDLDAPDGLSYYRLLQTDFNGGSTKSGVVALRRTNGGFGITNLYPVPALDRLEFGISQPEAGSLQVRVYNTAGKLAFEQTVPQAEKQWQHSLDVSQLPGGLYFLNIYNGKEHLTEPFVKQ